MTLKSDPSPAAADDHPRRRAPWKWAMWVVVGVWRRELQRILRRPVVRCDHCDTANDHRWDNSRLCIPHRTLWRYTNVVLLFIIIIVADLHCLSDGGCHVGLCVFVNAVCAGEQCTCEMCIPA